MRTIAYISFKITQKEYYQYYSVPFFLHMLALESISISASHLPCKYLLVGLMLCTFSIY